MEAVLQADKILSEEEKKRKKQEALIQQQEADKKLLVAEHERQRRAHEADMRAQAEKMEQCELRMKEEYGAKMDAIQRQMENERREV